MLSKSYRIQKNSDFSKIYKNGFKIRGVYGMLVGYSHDIYDNTSNNQIKDTANLGTDTNSENVPDLLLQDYIFPRFGFILSKKIGKAVQRNKMKRWLRNIARQILNQYFLSTLTEEQVAKMLKKSGLDLSYIAFKYPVDTQDERSGFHELKREYDLQFIKLMMKLYELRLENL